MTELSSGIHIYSMPMCSACEQWKEWLRIEGMEYTEHPLADLVPDVGGSVPDALLTRISTRQQNGDYTISVAPTIFSVHGDGRVVLISEGDPPAFWGSDAGFVRRV